MRRQLQRGLALSLMATAIQVSAGHAYAQSPLAQVPAEVSAVEEGSQGIVYRKSSNSLRLYTYDKDPAGQSVCDEGCASAWPPVYASASATPMGDWSLVTRTGGARQWALKGKPVYTHFHDSPSEATGESVPGWHLLQLHSNGSCTCLSFSTSFPMLC